MHRLGVFPDEDTAVTTPDDQIPTPIADLEDPDTSDQDALHAMRERLTQRINAAPRPSVLINRLAAADWRCSESVKSRARLILNAPKVLRVIRAVLRKTFDLDPDSLLFTEPKPPAVAQKVDTLTDRALQVLVLPSLSINLNHFTAVSLKGEPTQKLPFTALEALQRVAALNLFARLAQAWAQYWQALAPGGWQTRKEHWVESHKQLFADQAFLARQLDELSSAGMAMVQALVDAPTMEARQRAGEQWASVQVCELMWPGVGPRLMPILGALHIYRQGDPSGMPHVIFLPGARRNYYEYPSFEHLQCGLVALINGALFDDLWQCLPLRRRHEVCTPGEGAVAGGRGLALTGDALALSAQAVLEGQWENELACAVSINLKQVYSRRLEPAAPNAARFLRAVERSRKHWVGRAPLGGIRRELLSWDQRRRREEIIFSSTAPGLALNTVLQQVKRYERGLMRLLAPEDPGKDTEAFQAFAALEDQLKVQAGTLGSLLCDAQLQLFDTAFWKARPNGKDKRIASVIYTWIDRLRSEVQLQHRLSLIGTPHRDVLIEVLDQPLASKRQGSETCVLAVIPGSESDAFVPLHNLFVVTRSAAISDPGAKVPVVLCALGRDGGLMTFASLGAVSRGIKASLGSPDESPLWRSVERLNRKAVREHVAGQTLTLRYAPMEGNPILLTLKRLFKSYIALQRGLEGGTAVFSETQNVQLSRLLLAAELDAHLSAPAGDALLHARANFDLVRKAFGAKQQLLTWLSDATAAQIRRFKHLQGRYLGSNFAYESRINVHLPDLHTFGRNLLVARLREDGLSPLIDIDTPFIEMPDQVDSRFCGWESGCTVGDRKPVLTPSAERTCFSLLQLALHNLDPQMMPTRWRFNYARYLQPTWEQPLNPEYLIGMVSALDIGGQYDTLIKRVFYPPDAGARGLSEVRVPELLRRAVQDAAAAHLYSAAQQGLSAQAQRLFNTAMGARTAEDLRKHADHLQLHVVHLVGHTLLHDRYIAGILVLHDRISQRCVVYWPTAPDALSISEHASLREAQAHLNRSLASPATVTALACHVAPGWAFEAITHNPGEMPGESRSLLPVVGNVHPGYAMLQGVWQGGEFVRSFAIKHRAPTALVEDIEKQIHEQIASDALNWLALVPTSHADAMALLYQARVLDQQAQAQAGSHSGKTLEKYREQRLEEEKDWRRRALLAMFVPFFGLGNQLYELLLTARRYHLHGDPRDAVAVAFGAVLLTIDLLLTFVPGPKPKVGSVGRPMIGSISAGLNRIHRSTASPFGRVSPLSRPPSALARLTPLERFRLPKGDHDAVALTGQGQKGVFVKNSEHFIVDDAQHYPVYRRDGEDFYRLKNRGSPRQDELVLTIHEPGEWLLGADAPVAGPSSGVLRPWQPPAPALSWQPPNVSGALQNRILQSPAPANYWFSWRTPTPPIQSMRSSASGVYHVPMEPPGFPYNVIHLGPGYDTALHSGSGYYRLLHQGDSASSGPVSFISKHEPLVSKAHIDIERWTTTALHEQPIPVSRTPAGEWQVHARLFDGPLEPLVARAFPGLTRSSQVFAVARLTELADASRSATASHLLNVRATLDHWLTPNPVRLGQTDDLMGMLRPTERRGHAIFIGYEGKAPGFTRVDFVPPQALEQRLKSSGAQLTAQRQTAQRAAVKAVLEQQGFRLDEWAVTRNRYAGHELVMTHPHSSHVYYVMYQWVERASIVLRTKLTDKWLNLALNSHKDSALSATVSSAMAQQRLVRIVAGIQWPRYANLPPTVYFVKLNSL